MEERPLYFVPRPEEKPQLGTFDLEANRRIWAENDKRKIFPYLGGDSMFVWAKNYHDECWLRHIAALAAKNDAEAKYYLDKRELFASILKEIHRIGEEENVSWLGYLEQQHKKENLDNERTTNRVLAQEKRRGCIQSTPTLPLYIR